MSYFLCLATPVKINETLAEFTEFNFIEANNFPIGKATSSGKQSGEVVLVTYRGCSTDILGYGDKEHNLDQKFLVLVKKLVEEAPVVSVLVHFARDLIDTENVKEKTKQKLLLQDFNAIFPKLDEDVRYVITS